MSSKPLAIYLASVAHELQARIGGEHAYRPYLKALIEALVPDMSATNEPKREKCGAPDYVVTQETNHGALIVGYIETKDVGVPLERISESDQGQRYLKSLENLVFTDYLSFQWYVNGIFRSSARLGSVDSSGRLSTHQGGPEAVEGLLKDFLAHSPAPISKPQELALRMARLAHVVRDIVIGAFESEEASETLRELYTAFKVVLLPDLKVNQFADMFAQTLAYGLFAARVNHSASNGRFMRLTASAEIQRTNPFLRKLFGAITGVELNDEPFVSIVDDLVQLLADTEIETILADFGKRTRQEDPVVHFYETFLKAYDPKLRELRGVYYTPEPVVSYIVSSVDHLLKNRFSCPDGLADATPITYTRKDNQNREYSETSPRVLILDPACGTGTFLYAIVDRIRDHFMQRRDAGQWSSYVRDHLLPRLFGFELLMAPYAMAHFKLGMQLAAKDLPEAERADWTYDASAGPRVGVYMTNSLEKALQESQLLLGGYISQEANAAAKVKRDLRIMVVLGNPPYAGHSANKGIWIHALVEDYKRGYPDLMKPAQAKWLQDDYVKFLRFGQWRIDQTGAGVLAFITNHGYLSNPTFRGMRQQLMRSFSEIYILNLHGSTKRRERAPGGGVDQNVFEIQQGVAIGIFIKTPGKPGASKVHYADLWGTRNDKYQWLSEHDLPNTEWAELLPTQPQFLFTPQTVDHRAEYEKGWRIPDIMSQNGDPAPGLVTTQDDFAVSWSPDDAKQKTRRFLETGSEAEARGIWRLCSQSQWNYQEAKSALVSGKWEQKIQQLLYRPFDDRWTIFDSNVAVHLRNRVMTHMIAGSNVALATTRSVEIARGFEHVFCSRSPIQHHTVSIKEVNYLFPLYLYSTSGTPMVSRDDIVEREQLNLTRAVHAGTVPEAELAALQAAARELIYRFFPMSQYPRWPNLSPTLVAEIADRLTLQFVPDGQGDLSVTFGPEDVFYYIYAILHSPSYRSRYAEYLKQDFPRVPITDDLDLFRVLDTKGAELAALHLLESPVIRKKMTHYPVPGPHIVEVGHPRYLAPGEPEPGTSQPLAEGRVYISSDRPKIAVRGQYFGGVPQDVWEFHIGGYHVCHKWLENRRGRALTGEDRTLYEQIVVALSETIRLMAEIDRAIENHGGWPL